MAKRFKLRFSKAVSSFHSSCRSKDPSTLPQDPLPSFFRQSSLNPTTTTNTKLITTVDYPAKHQPSHHHNRRFPTIKRHVTAALNRCGLTTRSVDAHTSDQSRTTRSRNSHEFKWQREENWHVVANTYDDDDDNLPRRKISYSSVSDDSDGEILCLPPPPPPRTAADKNKRRSRKKKSTTTKAARVLRLSTSSADDSGMFSSEACDEIDDDLEEDETETLVSSSRSFEFSTDSSSEYFNPHLETIYESTTTRRRHRRNSGTGKRRSTTKHSKRSVSSSTAARRSSVSSDGELPARLSVFKKLIPCTVDGKVKESFAIVKKSQDPYEDFKRSMMEMIMEKQMFEKEDLEQLLQCFLSLNAKHYHGVIVEAFTEIWKTLFSAAN